MINDDYCSYEVSELISDICLKDPKDPLNNIIIFKVYEKQKKHLTDVLIEEKQTCAELPIVSLKDSVIGAPTHQNAIKWLRRKYLINIIADYDYFSKKYKSIIKSMINLIIVYNSSALELGGFDSYSECVDSALKYVLTNIIYS